METGSVPTSPVIQVVGSDQQQPVKAPPSKATPATVASEDNEDGVKAWRVVDQLRVRLQDVFTDDFFIIEAMGRKGPLIQAEDNDQQLPETQPSDDDAKAVEEVEQPAAAERRSSDGLAKAVEAAKSFWSRSVQQPADDGGKAVQAAKPLHRSRSVQQQPAAVV